MKKILSLFDGISGGQIAINNLGLKDYTYYASEINKNSIAVTQKNFPNTIQLGDVVKLRRFLEANIKVLKRLIIEKHNKYAKLILKIKTEGIDLLIFGFPCTDLTIIKSKTRESLKGSQLNTYYKNLFKK
mgnify:CR=1 FL=1